jgi:serine/threonine protein kinase
MKLSAADFLPGNTRLTLLHSGRFSLVYKAEKDGQAFILKQLHPRLEEDAGAIEAFRREAEISSAHVPDYAEQDGHHYLLREYVEGQTLKFVLSRSRYRSAAYREWRERLLPACAGAVKKLHENSIVHGDIKPANFIVSSQTLSQGQTPDVTLIDLGLAHDMNVLRTDILPLQYSMYYAAPEAVLNFPLLTGIISDVYSLGMLWYEILSGRLPYVEHHPARLLQLMIVYDLQPAKRISAYELEILRKATTHPRFTKPVHFYSRAEQEQLLCEAQERRWRNVQELVDAWLDRPQQRKKHWLFG